MHASPFDKAGYLWVNGKFVPWHQAKIHLMTHSLHYGSSVFEGMRAYNSKIFKLDQHIERLFLSAQQLGFTIDYRISDIIDVCKELINQNNLNNAYIRPLVWRGSESSRLSSPLLSTNIMISGWEVSAQQYQPLSLCFSNWVNVPPQSMPIQCKSGARYATMLISKKESEEQGFDDAILLDWRGYISECTTSNIFFIPDDRIVTPIADACLNGITRQTIFEIAKKLGIMIVEQHIIPELLLRCQECFITGTAAEIKEVGFIDFAALKEKNMIIEKLYDTKNNPITKVIQDNYRKLVNE